MHTKAKVLTLLASLICLYASIAMGAEKKGHSKRKEVATYIDASGPVSSSEFPTVVKKGAF